MAETGSGLGSGSMRTFAAGLVAGLAGSYVLWKYHQSRSSRSSRMSALGKPVEENQIKEKGKPAAKMDGVLTDEVLKEQLTRNIQFFGEKVQLDLANSFVVVVGLGVSA